MANPRHVGIVSLVRAAEHARTVEEVGVDTDRVAREALVRGRSKARGATRRMARLARERTRFAADGGHLCGALIDARAVEQERPLARAANACAVPTAAVALWGASHLLRAETIALRTRYGVECRRLPAGVTDTLAVIARAVGPTCLDLSARVVRLHDQIHVDR